MQQQDGLTLTPIYEAIKDNSTQQLINLINQGVNLEEPHPEYSAPLHYAISI